MIKKILIANRGEIAVRIIRACREMNIQTVAVYSQADSNALHTLLADEAICIGTAASKDSYLNMERTLSAAITMGADAIHPGFGFLSENSKFAKMCEKCMIKFIGPSAEVIDKMGNKAEARNTMIAANVPVVHGSKEPILEFEKGIEVAKEIGYPVMIKAVSGGGGRGMRVAECEEEFKDQFLTAQREAEKGFSDPTMYVERYVKEPRHIEFQILADSYGNVIHMGERDCSVQRRHQKLIEESPSPAISKTLREEMGKAAIKAAKAADYENAGTIEFLLDKNGDFYFIEMNTRIQVEHPVTEAVTGIDLIKEQIRIASGEKLKVKQADIKLRGHAIECRINAEDAKNNFMPCPGTITDSHFPGGFGIRIDSAIYNGYKIPPNYDSMIAKLTVHGKDREEAIDKMCSVLDELSIEGIVTNQEYQLEIIKHPVFRDGKQDTSFIEKYL